MGRDTLRFPQERPKRREVFVFGSNKAGRHGKGAAYHALKEWGAIYGLGWAMQGDSYAIPTKDERFNILPLTEIEKYVEGFLRFARSPHGRQLNFLVSAIGTGLAGYDPDDILPMFRDKPSNVYLSTEFFE